MYSIVLHFSEACGKAVQLTQQHTHSASVLDLHLLPAIQKSDKGGADF